MTQSQSDRTKLGFIGLGVMGGPMCQNLAEGSGHGVIVHDASADASAARVGANVEVGEDVGRIALPCDTIFLSLPGEVEVRAVCLGAAGLLDNARSGQVIVDCSTIPVSASQEIAVAFAAKGAAYVDAPVAGTAQSVGDRKISVMVGADDAVFAQVSPLLQHMAEAVLYCGASGSGTATKLLLNMVIAQSVVALAEALSLGRTAGLDGARLFQAFQHGCDSFALRQHGMTALLPGNFPEGTFPTRYMLKDLGYVMALKDQLGLTLDGMDVTHALLEKTLAAGHGDAYWPSLIKVIGQDTQSGESQ
ncbi:MAG: NAD(P)-dependent oxidoreductase [Alphaproteobacteria bacterium]|nr:NAD(P)-dependent oxidoreductase [Alphaproteobacteria bacterium]